VERVLATSHCAGQLDPMRPRLCAPPPPLFLVSLGPNSRGLYWRASVTQPQDQPQVSFSAELGDAPPGKMVVICLLTDDRGPRFEALLRSIDAAAVWARAADRRQRGVEQQQFSPVAVVVQGVASSPLDTVRWNDELQASVRHKH